VPGGSARLGPISKSFNIVPHFAPAAGTRSFIPRLATFDHGPWRLDADFALAELKSRSRFFDRHTITAKFFKRCGAQPTIH
jgi:hypothetical protein